MSKTGEDDDSHIQPFLKWAGGKRALMPELRKYLPDEFNAYFEPFLGGGAMLMELSSMDKLKGHICCSDISEPLIITYNTIVKKLPELKRLVNGNIKQYSWANQTLSKPVFLANRHRFNQLKGKSWYAIFEKLKEESEPLKSYTDEQLGDIVISSTENVNAADKKHKLYLIKAIKAGNPTPLEICLSESERVELAALFIYLNKTGFNGMYRENAYGVYNIPPGTYNNPLIYNWELLEKISTEFSRKNVYMIGGLSYELSLQFAEKGDFVYLDPPYDGDKMFTSYSKSAFDKKEQEELKKEVDRLTGKGVYVLLSNSGTDFIKNLYKDYTINVVSTKRFINSKSEDRNNAVQEVIVTNFTNEEGEENVASMFHQGKRPVAVALI